MDQEHEGPFQKRQGTDMDKKDQLIFTCFGIAIEIAILIRIVFM